MEGNVFLYLLCVVFIRTELVTWIFCIAVYFSYNYFLLLQELLGIVSQLLSYAFTLCTHFSSKNCIIIFFLNTFPPYLSSHIYSALQEQSGCKFTGTNFRCLGECKPTVVLIVA